MEKHELLAPAGNMESLYQAVYNGADAVYIAGKSFGARKFAANFSNEEIIKAIRFCHLYGVKVYVTMNTLIKNDEVDDFLTQIRFLHKNGVDAVIMQDFGMICLVREMFPNLEIHASTQANNSSIETVKMFYELGVKRVVFSRELTIDEIDNIDVPIEKEAFIHGALCISYSGCCLMSSMLGGRSGNRGECAGTCRMSYSLYHGNELLEKDKYLLSTKELNTTEKIDRLLKSSIYSFKIEGRMKSPLYVGFITNFYRKLIDGCDIDFSDYTDKLKVIFNREFSSGHLFFNNDKTIINDKSPNHIGLKIGSCLCESDKIKITLDKGRVINQHDAIRFLSNNSGMIVNYLYDKNDKLCSSSSDICYVDNKDMINGTDIVCKTQDSLLEKEFIRNSPLRRVKIKYFVYAHVGDELSISMSDGIHEVEVTGSIVQKSINAPIGVDTFNRALERLNDTPYEVENISFDIDSEIFIPVKELNEVRRLLVDKLNVIRENENREFIEREVTFDRFDEKVLPLKTCSVYNEEQLKVCLEFCFDRIYVRDRDLYERYKSLDNIYYYVDRCSYVIKLLDKNLVSDTFKYNKCAFGSYSLNITNIYTAYYLIKMGLKNIPLSVELSESEIISFIQLFNDKFGYSEFEVLGYGLIQNMVIKGNILNINCNDYEYNLIDSKNRCFPVYFDGEKTYVLNYEKRVTHINNVSLRYDFYKETSRDIENILNKVY